MNAHHARKERGFSLIEALVALVMAALAAGVIYVYLGRKLVDDDDPVKTAEEAGFTEAKVLSRHDFPSPFSACGSSNVSFALGVRKGDGSSETIVVCCPAWFGPCAVKK